MIFLDSSVPDFELLHESLTADAAQNDRFEVIVLQSHLDGVDQISNVIANYDNISGIHIISHGSDGSVQLGNTLLQTGSLSGYANQVAAWGDSLTLDADILFYGCNLAESTEGEHFLESIAELTGADVAGSDDLTGHADLGGDWDFEYIVGVVETDLAFSVDVQENWNGTLESVTVTTLDDVVDRNATSVADLINDPGADGVISLREAIIASNANADADVIYLGAGVHTLSIDGGGCSWR